MLKKSKKEFYKSGSTYVSNIVGDGVASIPKVAVVAVMNNTWTAWDIPLGTRALSLRLREAQALKIGVVASPGTTYFTLASAGVIASPSSSVKAIVITAEEPSDIVSIIYNLITL